MSERCNNEVTCYDKSDEWNCSCPSYKPNPCRCKALETQNVCIGDEFCYEDEGKSTKNFLHRVEVLAGT